MVGCAKLCRTVLQSFDLNVGRKFLRRKAKGFDLSFTAILRDGMHTKELKNNQHFYYTRRVNHSEKKVLQLVRLANFARDTRKWFFLSKMVAIKHLKRKEISSFPISL